MVPTSQLFNEAASHTGSEVEVRLVAGAWGKFRAGDRDGYLALIAAAADQAYAYGAFVVALAQASMTDAATFVRHLPQPLTSPEASLTAAMEQLAKP
ncbi:hypothetical protein [Phyllobacterium sp. 628]|uniref:hypothetical protein n=1 Tax=Phyllobacterium sp. 628 TaxID=2718938 RepID=UPI001FCEA6AE|nr:hypothetical protein [Phyllobacterium sp. 628]